MDNTLPPGWVPIMAPDGRTYYCNESTKETTWTKPTAGESPASAPGNAAPPSDGDAAASHRYTLATLVSKTGQKDHGQGHFELEKPELLEINIGSQAPFAWIKTGSMIARRGNIKFTRQGVGEQGFRKLAKKALTGEGVKLAKAEGRGKVFCADQGKKVVIVNLQNERMFINGNDVLALSSTVKYDIKMMRGGSMAGGLFNVAVSGSGMIAFGCHGSPTTLTATPGNPVYTDPNATVAWTHDPELVSDISMKAMLGRGTGEEFQMCFRQGHVVVQPYEEIVTYGTGSAGTAAGGGMDSLFGAFG